MKQNIEDSKEGRRLHGLAEQARESGKFLEALEFSDQATIVYEKDGDLLGLAEVQSSRQSTFKHLFRSTGDKIFLILEKHAAWSAVEIAEASAIKEAVAVPYHNLGKFFLENKEYPKAVMFFGKAVENLEKYPNLRHGRDAVILDVKGHLYAAKYLSGDETALNKALEVLEKLKDVDEDSYNKNVWVSGAHLRIAEMLFEDDQELANKHLNEAEKIIESDNRLVLRSEQLRKLKEQFSKT